jgi:subtilisin family serine protease/subtilisin-like proprotein convertase family protein
MLERLEDRTLLSASADPSLLLVQFRPGAGVDWSSLAVQGTTIVRSLNVVPGLYEVQTNAGTSSAQGLAAYHADPLVLAAEVDETANVSLIPNDPQFSQQWDMLNTGQNSGTKGADDNATQAWNATTGSPGVVVAVMDTGIDYDNPDLYLNIWINQAEIPKSRLKNLVDVNHDGYISFRDLNNPINQGPGKITDINHDGVIDAADILAPMVLNAQGQDTGQGGWAFPGNTQDGDTAHPNDFIGWNFVNNTNDPFDDNGHGTHVAGTIGAVGNNGVGVAGVDWNVQIMPVKFLDSTGTGTETNFLSALSFSIQHGAQITNNSWDGFGDSPIVFDAIQTAQAHGQIFVAAAGNGSGNNDVTPDYPSSFNLDNIVSVAATDQNNKLAGFSNFGASTVDLGAPGVDILSTTPNDTYSIMSGTSMAAPHVTGTLALVWGEHPTWTYKQVIAQVENTVTKVPALEGKTVTGGLLNIGAAVGAAPTTTPPPTVTGVTETGATTGNLTGITITFSDTIGVPSIRAAGSITLTGPTGNVIPITAINIVANTTDKQFTLSFAPQTAAGTYTLSLSSAILDRDNDPLVPYKTTFQVTTPGSTSPTVTGVTETGATSGNLTGITVTFSKTIGVPSIRAAGSITLTGPTGNVIPITAINIVANTTDKQFTLSFAPQTAAGTYTLSLSSAILDRDNNPLVPFKTTFQVSQASPLSFSNSTTTSIPDLGTAISSINVTNPVVIRSVTVKVNINHTYDGDLYIHLQAPNGKDILLSNRNGGAGHNYINTVFDDNASTSILHGVASFTGSYKPEVNLSNLAGSNAQGTWRLWVEDRAHGDFGTLLNWTLTFNGTTTVASGQAGSSPDPKNSKDGPGGASTTANPSSTADQVFASRAALARVQDDTRLHVS